MQRYRLTGVAMTFAIAAGALVSAGQRGSAPATLPLSNAIREQGSSVTPAYEGWYYNTDGSISLLVGYFNRNTKQVLDVPIGPNNRIEPGVPDQGQPTHFLTGRQWGVFAIRVPKDFGTKKLTWTIVSNGQTNTVTLHTKPDWVVEPFEDAGSKNSPPRIKLEADGPTLAGPPVGVAASYIATPNSLLPLTVWVTDEGSKINVTAPRPQNRARSSSGAPIPLPPPLSIAWSKYRGPGDVTFANVKPPIDKTAEGKAMTTATFSAPGEYVLRIQANDQSGDGGAGFQCCWTNAHVKVTVKSQTSSQ